MGGSATINGKPCQSTDNFLNAPMVLDGVTWPSCEQWFQAVKFDAIKGGRSTRLHCETIRTCGSGEASWSLGQSRAHTLRADWEEVKAKAMYRAVQAKYAQYPKYAKELAASKGTIRAMPSTADWTRLNSLILQKVRDELREAKGQKPLMSKRDRQVIQKLLDVVPDTPLCVLPPTEVKVPKVEPEAAAEEEDEDEVEE